MTEVLSGAPLDNEELGADVIDVGASAIVTVDVPPVGGDAVVVPVARWSPVHAVTARARQLSRATIGLRMLLIVWAGADVRQTRTATIDRSIGHRPGPIGQITPSCCR